jgi:putative hydrolase of the HAD superfamily
MMERNDKPEKKKYACIFFDLDHTLWDYETNSKQTLEEMYDRYDLRSKGVDSRQHFVEEFKRVNTLLWDQFDRGAITSDVIRKERFKQILETFHAYSDKLFEDLSHDYITESPRKGNLMPYAREVLDYLIQHYRLSIITNGFDDIQHTKMTASKLLPYFDHVITSQSTGCRKPSCDIFNIALQRNGIKHHQAIMIGDNLVTDIGGANSVYIDTVFFNPEKNSHDSFMVHEINCLSELRRIL